MLLWEKRDDCREMREDMEAIVDAKDKAKKSELVFLLYILLQQISRIYLSRQPAALYASVFS
jgi:hypothetical protein